MTYTPEKKLSDLRPTVGQTTHRRPVADGAPPLELPLGLPLGLGTSAATSASISPFTPPYMLCSAEGDGEGEGGVAPRPRSATATAKAKLKAVLWRRAYAPFERDAAWCLPKAEGEGKAENKTDTSDDCPPRTNSHHSLPTRW